MLFDCFEEIIDSSGDVINTLVYFFGDAETGNLPERMIRAESLEILDELKK